MPRSLAFLLLVSIASSAAAEEYRCQVKPGLVRYQSTPCETLMDKARADNAAATAKREKAAEDEHLRIKAMIAADLEKARADPWGVAESVCEGAMREQMKYLEPTGRYSRISREGDDVTLRVIVRLADSFRAAPVGVIECRANLLSRHGFLEKLRN